MVWLAWMLFGMQVLCSCTAAPAARGAGGALLCPRCNDAAVEAAADLALRQINADREEGYVLSLYRIVSAREQPQEITGSVFYLILDVVDTECHVLSKKLWKNCNTRPAHSTVYGQCKAIIYINQARNIAHLNTYECTLQPVPGRYIWSVCPDCPVDDSPTKPEYLKAAARSLAKFNGESEQTHYFSVLNVTRASMQWVIGPAYFVEFLIQETSCSKDDRVTDTSMCEPLPPEVAKIGFCKGSVVNSGAEQFVTISCEIYSQQDPATEEENQEANQTPGKSMQDQQASPSDANSFSLHLEKTVGWVKILPPSNEDITFHSLRESQNEHKDRKPVPPKAVGSAHRCDGEKTQVNKPDLTKPVTGPVILPFPEEPSLSDSCPGEAKQAEGILHPLITRKPTTV
ncbi:fetuin-B isoform X1 [Serinus canaria]|uniref:fetuin-B isoform X1 n=1 Tax=Serinus canaria TaxID=9135 RepID=UPI0011AE6064|nr:fetuin-B isoform X1 [Serinus canaria]